MYFEHFGLNEAPFRITPHTDFFFAGANRGATLEALIYAILNDQGIVRVSGEVGSGKTMLCRMLAESLPEHVDTIYLANPLLSRDEIIYALADELQLTLAAERPGALLGALQAHLIERHAAGRHVVALIDEAHAMPPDTLEQIRLLSNLETSRDKLLQIVVVGQPELDEMLARADMRQLRDRITHSFRLEPLVRDDVAEYIDFRMRAAGYRGPTVFSPAAIRRLAKASLGLTRRINILADKSLLAAFAANSHQVTAEHVKAAVRDTDAPSPGRSGAGRWRWAVAATVLLGLLAAAGQWWRVSHPGSVATRADAVLATADAPPPTPAPSPPAPSQPATAAEKPAQPAAPAGAPIDIPLAPARELAAATNPAPTVPAAEAAVDGTAPAAPSPPIDPVLAPLGVAFANRLVASEQWRERASPHSWFIQLATAEVGDPAGLARFLSRAAQQVDDARLRVFLDRGDTRLRVGIIYGDYPSAGAARTALRSMPASLRARGAYVRQLATLG
jgi:type II secretory pathway predicted ATPase ExeA/septal ring-binding cell division protein DamX